MILRSSLPTHSASGIYQNRLLNQSKLGKRREALSHAREVGGSLPLSKESEKAGRRTSRLALATPSSSPPRPPVLMRLVVLAVVVRGSIRLTKLDLPSESAKRRGGGPGVGRCCPALCRIGCQNVNMRSKREESVKVQRVGRGKEQAAGVPPRQGRSSSRRWKKVDGPSRSSKEAAAKRSPSSPVTQGRGLVQRGR